MSSRISSKLESAREVAGTSPGSTGLRCARRCWIPRRRVHNGLVDRNHFNGHRHQGAFGSVCARNIWIHGVDAGVSRRHIHRSPFGGSLCLAVTIGSPTSVRAQGDPAALDLLDIRTEGDALIATVKPNVQWPAGARSPSASQRRRSPRRDSADLDRFASARFRPTRCRSSRAVPAKSRRQNSPSGVWRLLRRAPARSTRQALPTTRISGSSVAGRQSWKRSPSSEPSYRWPAVEVSPSMRLRQCAEARRGPVRSRSRAAPQCSISSVGSGDATCG